MKKIKICRKIKKMGLEEVLMKKLLFVLLSLLVFSSLSACGGQNKTDKEASSSSPSSGSSVGAPALSDTSSFYETSGGFTVEYNSIALGYIDHVEDYNFNIINFPGFECMDDEVLLLPKGTIITCENSFAVYCYEGLLTADELRYNDFLSETLGQTITPTKDVQLKSGTYTATENLVVRFSVRGKLSDVTLFVEKGKEDEVILMTEADYIKEYLS